MHAMVFSSIVQLADGTNVTSTHSSTCKKCTPSSTSHQQKLYDYFSSAHSEVRVPPRIKSAITQACCEFAAVDMRAFETIAGNGFMHLIQTIFNA
jgi:hypothetical protein